MINIDNENELEKALKKLSKWQLIHLLAWGIDAEAIKKALNNERCSDCKVINRELNS
jgi:predicted Rossmann fold nucleotide-binding protein DprA/Smf involved in DNA uptake